MENWNYKKRNWSANEGKVGRRSIRVMDLRSESNLDKRLENVFIHHNAEKRARKKIFEKDALKKINENCSRNGKFTQPLIKIRCLKKKEKKYYLKALKVLVFRS